MPQAPQAGCGLSQQALGSAPSVSIGSERPTGRRTDTAWRPGEWRRDLGGDEAPKGKGSGAEAGGLVHAGPLAANGAPRRAGRRGDSGGPGWPEQGAEAELPWRGAGALTHAVHLHGLLDSQGQTTCPKKYPSRLVRVMVSFQIYRMISAEYPPAGERSGCERRVYEDARNHGANRRPCAAIAMRAHTRCADMRGAPPRGGNRRHVRRGSARSRREGSSMSPSAM